MIKYNLDEIEEERSKEKVEEGKRKKSLLIWLCMVYLSNFMTVSSLAPIYPAVALEKGLSQSMIGLVFSIELVISILINLNLGKRMGFYGRKNIILLG